MIGAVDRGGVTPAAASDAVITDDQGIRGHLSVILSAILRAVDIDRTAIALRPGIVAAIPVAAMMALGTIIDQPVAAVTLGVGAMLVGVAWRAGPGPVTPPLGTMGAAALMLAFSTLVGTITGRWDWLHLGVLFVFCLLAGAASAIGRRGSVVGTQTLIAFIVFGRFPESLLGGLRLAGLVLGGGVAQLLFAALVASPLAWRRQRRELAEAYGQLAAIARQMTVSGVMAAQAFDAADQALAAPALFGDPQLAGLVTLVSEGRRMRLELLVLSSALSQPPHGAAEADPGHDDVAAALAVLAQALETIVATLRGGDPDDLERAADALKRWSDGRARISSPLLEARLAALGGQVRAVARQTVAVARSGADRTWRLPHPSLGAPRRGLGALRADLQQIRDATNLSSPAGRHAIRLAVVVAGTELLTQRLAIPRGYWAVVAAATVLRPNFADTITRGAERMGGTVAGAVLATLIAMAIDPSGWGIVVTIGILATLSYTLFSASFALGVAGLTAMIVFLLHGQAPDSGTVALDRGLDTLIGGAIGLGVTVIWPTWSSDALPRGLQTLVSAQRDYLGAVLSGVLTGRPLSATAVLPLARHVRIAFGDADSTLTVARGEPVHQADALDVASAEAALTALRRVTYAVHALRLASSGPVEPFSTQEHRLPVAGAGAAAGPGAAPGAVAGGAEPVRGKPHPELAPLGDGLQRALVSIGARLSPDGAEPAPLPPLRELYRASATGLGDGIGLALDELVDAIDSAAAALDS